MGSKHDITGDGGTAVAALSSASLTADTVPSRALLAPWGSVDSVAGSFVVDEESVRLVEEAYAEHGIDLPIDYEHQTLGGAYSSPNGQAPAAGWIKSISGEAGVGIVAEIEWTDPAREVLATRQYRYLSPVAVIRKSDRKLIAIHSAALTNKPAIVGMEPIVNRDSGVVDDEVLAGGISRLRDSLSMPEDSECGQVLVAASDRLVELEHQIAGQRIEQRLQEAQRSGHLVESQLEWARALILKDESLFDEWLKASPTVVMRGATRPPRREGVKDGCEALALRARSEFHANPVLAAITSEEAYVKDAIRRRGGD